MSNISIWEPVNVIRNDFERLFSDFVPTSVKKLWGYDESGSVEPAVDVIEKEDSIIVRAELPGVSRDEVKLEIHESRLTIKGEHKAEKEDKKEDYYRKEIGFGAFCRNIELPSGVDSSSASASMKDGILEVTVKKNEPAKSVAIEVK
ncbi:MAG TPA: Hsp20/alpha crystallin family protein [bacterium]|nr:Hsp20/alpha crystallin family protein [bacterium]